MLLDRPNRISPLRLPLPVPRDQLPLSRRNVVTLRAPHPPDRPQVRLPPASALVSLRPSFNSAPAERECRMCVGPAVRPCARSLKRFSAGPRLQSSPQDELCMILQTLVCLGVSEPRSTCHMVPSQRRERAEWPKKRFRLG